MFNKLVASEGRKNKALSPTTMIASVAAHVLLLGGAVYASEHTEVGRKVKEEVVSYMEIEPEQPKAPEPPKPAGPALRPRLVVVGARYPRRAPISGLTLLEFDLDHLGGRAVLLVFPDSGVVVALLSNTLAGFGEGFWRPPLSRQQRRPELRHL